MYKDILLPIDIYDETLSWEKKLNLALEYSTAFNSKLHILYVVPSPQLSFVQHHFFQSSRENYKDKIIKEVKAMLKDFVAKNIPENIEVSSIVGLGSVYDCIIETSEKVNADLIVIYAHRKGLTDYLLGPNAAKVVRHSNKSVLVIRD